MGIKISDLQKLEPGFIRIQDFHPNPKNRAQPAEPREFTDNQQKKHFFNPILVADDKGGADHVFYELTEEYARALLAGDYLKRYYLVEPSALTFRKKKPDMSSEVVSMKALANPRRITDNDRVKEKIIEATAAVSDARLAVTEAEKKVVETKDPEAKQTAENAVAEALKGVTKAEDRLKKLQEPDEK